MRNLTTAQAIVFCLLLLAASLPAFWGGRVNSAMLLLLPDVDFTDAYFTLIEPFTQYLAIPVVLLSVTVALLTPGLLFTAAIGRAANFYSWIIEAFVVSLLTISALTALVQHLIGKPLVGSSFLFLVIGLSLLGAVIFTYRVAQGRVDTSFDISGFFPRMAVMLGIPILLAVALTPKIFWEAFNGDGAHTYEATRLLLFQVWPFWSDSAGDIRHFPGVNGLTLMYPLSWFMRIFGFTESSVRLPFFMFLPMMYAGLRAVIETKREQILGRVESGFVWVSVLTYALVMSFSATYNPYNADISMPGAHDTLLMIFILGAFTAWTRRESGWLFTWTMLALATSPAGLLIYAGAVLGILVSSWPWRWKVAFRYGLALLACLILLLLTPLVLSLFGVHKPGAEHTTGLLSKFAFIALGDFERILYAFLPVGLYPAVALFAWRGADESNRVMIVVTAVVFSMYYVIGGSSLHQFVPAMILPVAVFWRRFHAKGLGFAGLAACTVLAVAGIWFAIPLGTGIYSATRDIGARIDASRFPGYHEMQPEAFAASDRLHDLFPSDADEGVPEIRYGDSSLAWHYYAQNAVAESGEKTYLMVPVGTQVPAGAYEAGRDGKAVIYVIDEAQWGRDKLLQPTHSRGNNIYHIPPNELFIRGKARERFGFFSPGIWLLDLFSIDYKSMR